jgi:hypothetical protein
VDRGRRGFVVVPSQGACRRTSPLFLSFMANGGWNISKIGERCSICPHWLSSESGGKPLVLKVPLVAMFLQHVLTCP